MWRKKHGSREHKVRVVVSGWEGWEGGRCRITSKGAEWKLMFPIAETLPSWPRTESNLESSRFDSVRATGEGCWFLLWLFPFPADKHSYRKSHSSVCEMFMKKDPNWLGEIIVITLRCLARWQRWKEDHLGIHYLLTGGVTLALFRF